MTTKAGKFEVHFIHFVFEKYIHHSKYILDQSNLTLMGKGADYIIYVDVKQVDYKHVQVHVDRKHFGDIHEGIRL